jgi:glycosyltransferase involved in cell wall biosynthesis
MSCKHINTSLKNLYLNVYRDQAPTLVAVDTEHFGFLAAAEKVIELQATKLIFYDHRLNPSFILNALKAKGYPLENIKIVFHLYGNPAEKLKWWLQAYNSSPQSQWQFITSCSTSMKIFKTFFISSPPVLVMPFPITESALNVAEENIFEKLKSKDCAIYSGRLSPDKNIHLLIPLISKLRKKNPNLALILVGPFDDLHTFNILKNSNSYQQIISNLITEFDPNNEFIFYFSKVEQNELNQLYKASKIMISLSTLFGEDFGMSIAEGAKLGLSVYLTRWGGYKDHSEHLSGLNYINVKIDQNDYSFELPAKLRIHSDQEREEMISLNNDVYSNQYCQEKYKEIFNNEKIKVDLIRVSNTLNRNIKLFNNEFIKDYDVLWK